MGTQNHKTENEPPSHASIGPVPVSCLHPPSSHAAECGGGDWVGEPIEEPVFKLKAYRMKDGRFAVGNQMNGPFQLTCLPETARMMYTLNDTLPIDDNFYNDFANAHAEGTKEAEDKHHWKKTDVEELITRIEAGETFLDSYSDVGPLIEALRRHPLKGKKVLVVGGQTPWVQACAVWAGAKEVVTSEFVLPTSDHPKLRAIHALDLEQNPERFDAIISYSSQEHDGLGRYSDPLMPNGDLETATSMFNNYAKVGTLFFLNVCTRRSGVIGFNAQRCYGAVRLPLLTRGFTFVERVGDAYGLVPGVFIMKKAADGMSSVPIVPTSGGGCFLWGALPFEWACNGPL